MVMVLLLAVTPALAGGWEIPTRYTTTLPGCYLYLFPGDAQMYRDYSTNVYAQASADSSVFAQIEQYASVTIHDVDAAQKWAYITTSDGVQGWVAASTLLMESVIAYDSVIATGQRGERTELLSEPHAGARVQGEYYAGTMCEILNPKPVYDGSVPYKLVRIGDRTGYVISHRLGGCRVSERKEVPAIMVRGGANGQNIIYAKANIDAQVLTTVPDGENVYVLGIRKDGWYHVMANGVIGYISGSLLVTQLPLDDQSQPNTDAATGATVTLTATEGSYYVVSSKSGNRVNLRSKPSSKGTVLAKYYTGTPVIQLDEVKDGYMFISIGAVKGYMDARFLATEPGGRESELIRCVVVPPVKGGSISMYSLNDRSSDIVRTAYDGEEAILIGVDGDWAHIVCGGEYGFVQYSELFELPEP